MNLLHRGFCASGFWSRIVSDRIAPWVLEGMDIGRTVLEIGAGPGAATAYLRTRASRLTCIDVDEPSATRLRNRMARHHVTVLCEDATATSFAGESFDAALCFSMLHHLPSVPLQDMMFAEVERVLRPGGTFAGFDICDTTMARLVHAFDTMTPVAPLALPARLAAAGFADIQVDVRTAGFRFRARRPRRG